MFRFPRLAPALALLLIVPTITSGCAWLPGFIQPGAATRSRQSYQRVPAEAWTAVPLRRTTTLDEHGRPASIVEELGVPSVLSSNEFVGSDEFIDSRIGYKFDANSDGQAVKFDATREVNERSYDAGILGYVEVATAQLGAQQALVERLVDRIESLAGLAITERTERVRISEEHATLRARLERLEAPPHDEAPAPAAEEVAP